MAIFPEGDGTVLPVSKTRLAICVAWLAHRYSCPQCFWRTGGPGLSQHLRVSLAPLIYGWGNQFMILFPNLYASEPTLPNAAEIRTNQKRFKSSSFQIKSNDFQIKSVTFQLKSIDSHFKSSGFEIKSAGFHLKSIARGL